MEGTPGIRGTNVVIPIRRRPLEQEHRQPRGTMKVSLMVTCLADALFPDVGMATVRLLRRLGVEVDFPGTQTCCGQPHFNSGYHDDPTWHRRALDLAGRTYELSDFLTNVLKVEDVNARFDGRVTYHMACHLR